MKKIIRTLIGPFVRFIRNNPNLKKKLAKVLRYTRVYGVVKYIFHKISGKDYDKNIMKLYPTDEVQLNRRKRVILNIIMDKTKNTEGYK